MKSTKRITAAGVRARLTEAMEALRDPTCGISETEFPSAILNRVCGVGQTKPEDRPRINEALAWLFLAEDGHQRLAAVGVAMGISHAQIGRVFGCSASTVGRRAAAGFEAIAAALRARKPK